MQNIVVLSNREIKERNYLSGRLIENTYKIRHGAINEAFNKGLIQPVCKSNRGVLYFTHDSAEQYIQERQKKALNATNQIDMAEVKTRFIQKILNYKESKLLGLIDLGAFLSLKELASYINITEDALKLLFEEAKKEGYYIILVKLDNGEYAVRSIDFKAVYSYAVYLNNLFEDTKEEKQGKAINTTVIKANKKRYSVEEAAHFLYIKPSELTHWILLKLLPATICHLTQINQQNVYYFYKSDLLYLLANIPKYRHLSDTLVNEYNAAKQIGVSTFTIHNFTKEQKLTATVVDNEGNYWYSKSYLKKLGYKGTGFAKESLVTIEYLQDKFGVGEGRIMYAIKSGILPDYIKTLFTCRLWNKQLIDGFKDDLFGVSYYNSSDVAQILGISVDVLKSFVTQGFIDTARKDYLGRPLFDKQYIKDLKSKFDTYNTDSTFEQDSIISNSYTSEEVEKLLNCDNIKLVWLRESNLIPVETYKCVTDVTNPIKKYLYDKEWVDLHLEDLRNKVVKKSHLTYRKVIDSYKERGIDLITQSELVRLLGITVEIFNRNYATVFTPVTNLIYKNGYQMYLYNKKEIETYLYKETEGLQKERQSLFGMQSLVEDTDGQLCLFPICRYDMEPDGQFKLNLKIPTNNTITPKNIIEKLDIVQDKVSEQYVTNQSAQLVSAREKAKEWGLSDRRMRQLCLENKIEGAKKIKGSWHVPENSQRP